MSDKREVKAYEKIREFRQKDLTVLELHKKYAKSNYFEIHRGYEYLGTIKKLYGSYRFFPARDVNIIWFDMISLGDLLKELRQKEK